MNTWNNFFAAIVGASATLSGLIFVGVSISLNRILPTPKLSGRALESLILLLNVLIIAALCLVPGQPVNMLGTEILGISILVWIITLIIDIGMVTQIAAAYKRYYRLNILITQLCMLPYMVAGTLMLFQHSTAIYWLVPAILMSFVKSLIDGWILLVEIHR